MKRSLRVSAILVLLVAMTTLTAAAYNNPPYEDAWIDAASGYNDQYLAVKSSYGLAGCTPQYTTYVKWYVGTEADGRDLGTVTARFTVTYVNIGANSALALKAVANDWTETDINSTRPVPGATLATVPLLSATPPALNGTVTFSGDDNSELSNYVEAAVQGTGANYVSFALQVINCSVGTAEIEFSSSEGTAAPMLEMVGPNAVTLTDTSAQQTNSLPLYAGLGALALVAVVGVGLSRRRMAAR